MASKLRGIRKKLSNDSIATDSLSVESEKRTDSSPVESERRIDSSPTAKRGACNSDGLVPYVHNVSPVKRNRKDTMNYTMLRLQTRDGIEDALCFSDAKRPLFVEKESTRTAVKLTKYTKTVHGKKIIINDMTKVANPNQSEYDFQYEKSSNAGRQQSIKEVEETSNNGDLVNVAVKVLEIGTPRTVGTENWQIAEAIVADKSGTIELNLWEKYICMVIPGKTYVMKGLRKREWRSKKTLSTTRDTEIQEHECVELESIKDAESSREVERSKTIHVHHLNMIEKIEVYKKCANGKCNKKVMQVSSSVIAVVTPCERLIAKMAFVLK